MGRKERRRNSKRKRQKLNFSKIIKRKTVKDIPKRQRVQMILSSSSLISKVPKRERGMTRKLVLTWKNWRIIHTNQPRQLLNPKAIKKMLMFKKKRKPPKPEIQPKKEIKKKIDNVNDSSKVKAEKKDKKKNKKKVKQSEAKPENSNKVKE